MIEIYKNTNNLKLNNLICKIQKRAEAKVLYEISNFSKWFYLSNRTKTTELDNFEKTKTFKNHCQQPLENENVTT